MKDLKEIIEMGRDEFESSDMPSGHKERFLLKLNHSKANKRKVIYYLVAAAILAFLVLTPLYFTSGEAIECPDGLADYKTLLNEKSAKIYLLADKLEPNEKDMVMNTLTELVNETVPFENQLPPEMGESERSQLKQQYYCPKIQGVERLGKYVSQLINN